MSLACEAVTHGIAHISTTFATILASLVNPVLLHSLAPILNLSFLFRIVSPARALV
ncbi:unnamed protein product [Meloidogyne enterolobii]|uniref:Uncharacterized protein n=1 Tax=Meloidogyne enterolobii TaxID=390850 RepID=A0ACB0YM81_MELEN